MSLGNLVIILTLLIILKFLDNLIMMGKYKIFRVISQFAVI